MSYTMGPFKNSQVMEKWYLNDGNIFLLESGNQLQWVLHNNCFSTVPMFHIFLIRTEQYTNSETAANCRILNILVPDSIRGS